MSYEKLATMIRRLDQQTEKGKVPWQKTASPSRFIAVFGDSVVRITQTTVETPDHSYTKAELSITDAEGNLLEEVDSNDLERWFHDDYLDDLFAAARRYAMGVDKALDSILEELGEEEPPPGPPSDDEDIPF
jgi:hypothetical protein